MTCTDGEYRWREEKFCGARRVTMTCTNGEYRWREEKRMNKATETMFEIVSRTAVIYRFLGTHLTHREERVFFIY